MPLTAEHIEFWKDFICTECQFPAPDRLRAQFLNAVPTEFCDCGCNSFELRHGIAPARSLSEPTPSKVNFVFEADFRLGIEGKSLEILLFTDGDGYLTSIEIDCNGNSEPVPGLTEAVGGPYHLRASPRLLSDNV